MGKHLRQQRRGRGGPVYRSPSHRHMGAIKHPEATFKTGTITDIVHAPGRSGPLAKIDFQGKEQLVIAAEGMMVGKEFQSGLGVPAIAGNILPLAALPEGSLCHNIEARPGDGGKYVRASGGVATVTSGRKLYTDEIRCANFTS